MCSVATDVLVDSDACEGPTTLPPPRELPNAWRSLQGGPAQVWRAGEWRLVAPGTSFWYALEPTTLCFVPVAQLTYAASQ